MRVPEARWVIATPRWNREMRTYAVKGIGKTVSRYPQYHTPKLMLRKIGEERRRKGMEKKYGLNF